MIEVTVLKLMLTSLVLGLVCQGIKHRLFQLSRINLLYHITFWGVITSISVIVSGIITLIWVGF